MSNRSSAESGYVFTDFLACEVCFRDYDVNKPSVPFWITSCGHVLCESHRPGEQGQTCMKCGTVGTSFTQYGPGLAPEVAVYFEPVLTSIDGVTRAARYQEQYLYNLITFFKEKTLKQKGTLDGIQGQLKTYDETVQRVADLEQEVVELRNQLGRGRMGPPSLPGSIDGDGRKRLRDVDMHNSDPGERRARSPSGSLLGVLPPNRLSLKPSQRTPSAAAVANDHKSGARGGGGSRETDRPAPMDIVRPSSGLDRFAYNPTPRPTSRRISSTPRAEPPGSGGGGYDAHPPPPHESIQLTSASRLNHQHQNGSHRFSFPPSTPIVSRTPSRLAGRGVGGGGGGSSGPIRAMPPPHQSVQTPYRPTSVIYNTRNPPPSQHFSASQPPPHSSRLLPPPPPPPGSGTPRPSTASRVPFVPLTPQHYGGGGGGGGGDAGPSRPVSRVAAGTPHRHRSHQQEIDEDVEQWGNDQRGVGGDMRGGRYVNGDGDGDVEGYGFGGG